MSHDQTCGDRLAKLVRDEVDELRRQLRRARGQQDRAVHKARKTLQRLRAVVQLLGPLVPEAVRQENRTLRRLRQRLAPLRDAAARAETLRLLATRKRWSEHAPLLRQLAQQDMQQHRAAWAMHPPDGAFWDEVDAAVEQLADRVASWPLARVDEAALDAALEKAGRRLRKRTEAALGLDGREVRHEMRRKLRRYANMRRAAAEARGTDGREAEALLSLAKRCGHEGDLWLAIAALRRQAEERPELAELLRALKDARRAQCLKHDEPLRRLVLGKRVRDAGAPAE